MSQLEELFAKKKRLLSIYFTAGFPELNDTAQVLKSLAQNGVDLVEVGMPFSDPLADGPVIQESSKVAISNGLDINHLFEQLIVVREEVDIPLVYMGYLNPIMQFGVDAFCKRCVEANISALIIPDLPLDVYAEEYKATFELYELKIVFLISPQTSDKRIREIDRMTDGFIYMVSSASTTGQTLSIEGGKGYFERIAAMNLRNKCIVGFGIRDSKTFNFACDHAAGAIIGSAFIKAIAKPGDLHGKITKFVRSIR